MVMTPPLQGGGPGFESPRAHHNSLQSLLSVLSINTASNNLTLSSNALIRPAMSLELSSGCTTFCATSLSSSTKITMALFPSTALNSTSTSCPISHSNSLGNLKTGYLKPFLLLLPLTFRLNYSTPITFLVLVKNCSPQLLYYVFNVET